MFNVEEFKKDFESQSFKYLIDYALKNKTLLFEDAVNVIIKSRVLRGKFGKPKNAKHNVKYLIKIGFFIKNKDCLELNKNFIPKNQLK